MAWGNKQDEFLQFDGDLENTTPKAYLFKGDGWPNAEWVPKSQVEVVDINEDKTRATLKIKKWLCEKNGWAEDEAVETEDQQEDTASRFARDLDDEVPF